LAACWTSSKSELATCAAINSLTQFNLHFTSRHGKITDCTIGDVPHPDLTGVSLYRRDDLRHLLDTLTLNTLPNGPIHKARVQFGRFLSRIMTPPHLWYNDQVSDPDLQADHPRLSKDELAEVKIKYIADPADRKP